MTKLVLLILCLFLTSKFVWSQNYHAIQGSSYAGSLGVGNNPASIINTPYPWDVNVLSFQYKNSTNAVTVLNYSLLSSPQKSQYRIDKGNYSRFANGNFNIHLLNTRIALDRSQSIAFGINVRGYAQIKTSRYSFLDTLSTLTSFLKINEDNPFQGGDLKSSAWMEIFGTYSRTVWDREIDRLNAGITIKATRGLSGVFASLQNVSIARNVQSSQPIYLVKGGNIRYGYSSNYDNWKEDKTTSENFRNFFNNTGKSLAFDLGVEYILKTQEVTGFYDDDHHYDYEWKIGLALLDLGYNQYNYGSESRYLNYPKEIITNEVLEGKFISINEIGEFNDSLSTIVSGLNAFTGKFNIINPARLVVNADRWLYDNFYLNGEVSLNLSSLPGPEKLHVNELNLITVTPRWETRRFGAYLPLQYNTKGQFWMGGACKAGPLLMGVHNLGNIFAKNKMQNGGGYLALVIRPGKNARSYRDKRYDCPK